MADYDAGRAFLQIVPSFRGVREAIRAEANRWADEVESAVRKSLPEGFTEGAKATEPVAKKKGTETGEAYGGAFARTVKTRVEAALKALPKVKVDADSSLADVKLAAIRAELEDLGKQQIGVDVDDAVALAQLRRLKTELDEIGADSASLQVRADTTAAGAELDKLAAHLQRLGDESPTVQVDADTAAADAKLAETKSEADRLGGSSPTISPNVDSNRALVGIGVIRAALLALTAAPVVIPIAVAGAALAGPLAAAGAGALGFGAVATPGLARIHTALQAQDSDQPGSAPAGRSAAAQVSQTNSIRLAQLGLADAQRGVAVAARQNAQAQAQAAEQVRTAEQSLRTAEQGLKQAQQQSLIAQQALTQARQDARRGLEDLANNLADAQLGERAATAALKDAKANLAAVTADPRSTGDQRAAAQLAADQATQALAEQRQQVTRLAADKSKADKAGIAGSAQVVAAQAQIQSAEQRVAAARQTAGNQQRALAKARADQAAVEVTNAERTRQAQEQVTRAQLGLATAQAAATVAAEQEARAQAAAAASTSKLDKAMADLTPTERASLGAFRDFGAAYRSWVSALEPDVFPAITGGLDLVKSLFKPLTPLVQGAADAFTHLEKDAGKALQSPFWTNALKTFGKLTGPAITSFGHIVGNILTGLAGIALALTPDGKSALSGIEHLSERFANFGKNADKPGGFQDFLRWVHDNLPKAVEWLKSVGEAVVKIGLALLPVGGYVLGGIKLLADVVDRMPPTLLGSIATAIFVIAAATKAWAIAEALLQTARRLGTLGVVVVALLALAAAFIYAWQHSETFRKIVTGVWDDIKKVFSAVAGFIEQWILAPFRAAPDKVAMIWGSIKKAFSTGWDDVKAVFSAVGAFFQKYFLGPIEAIPIALKKIWEAIKTVFYTGVNVAIDILNSLIGAVNFFLSKFKPTQKLQFDLIPHVGQKAPGKGFARAAHGMVVPGYAPGVDSVAAMLSPGEGVLVPEAVRALGPQWVLAVNAMFSQRRAGGPGYAGGGIVGGGLRALLPDPLGVLPGAGAGHGVLAKPLAATEQQLRQRGDAPGLIGLGMADRIGEALSAALDRTINAGSVAAGAVTGATGGQGVTRWSGTVAEALALLGQSQSLVGAVLQLIKFESGGNPTAINRCVPLETVILTRRGLLKHDDVQVGDETIGFNWATGRSEWTRITAVHHYEDAPLVRMENSRWHATTTANHRWVNFPRVTQPVEEPDQCSLCPWPNISAPEPLASCPECGWLPKAPRGVALHRRRAHGIVGRKASGELVGKLRRRGVTTVGGLRVHLAAMHGIPGAGSNKQAPSTTPSWVTTGEVHCRDRLLLAAPADTGDGLPITITEAAILGWIAGDGHVERNRYGASISISQTKPPMVRRLHVLLADTEHAEYIYGRSHTFRFPPEYARDLMRRAGHPKSDAARMVLAMSAEQRGAWLNAMIDAEGHRDWQPGYTRDHVGLSQTLGPVHDAIVLAAYLDGHRPRVLPHTRDHERWNDSDAIFLNRPVVSGDSLTKVDAGRASVWCVTTELGSWTAEEDGHVFLTGNSDINWQHGTPSVGLAQVIGPTFAGNAGPYLKTGPFAYGVSENPLANVYAGLHYGIAQYGSIANIPGIKSVLAGGPYLPYDQGGYLPPGMSAVFNGTGRPEPVLTGGQWDQIARSTAGGDGPMTITGTLDLGDGLTGKVQGVINAHEQHQARQVSYGRRQVAV